MPHLSRPAGEILFLQLYLHNVPVVGCDPHDRGRVVLASTVTIQTVTDIDD